MSGLRIRRAGRRSGEPKARSRLGNQRRHSDIRTLPAAVASLARAPVVPFVGRVFDEQGASAVGAGALHASASKLSCASRALVIAQ